MIVVRKINDKKMYDFNILEISLNNGELTKDDISQIELDYNITVEKLYNGIYVWIEQLDNSKRHTHVMDIVNDNLLVWKNETDVIVSGMTFARQYVYIDINGMFIYDEETGERVAYLV